MKADKSSFYKQMYQCLEARVKCNIGTSATMCKLLAYSVSAKCYKALQDPLGKHCGYVIWANINEEAAYQLENNKLSPVYPHEWYEGDVVLVLDVVVDPMYRLNVASQLRGFIRNNRFNLHRYDGSYFGYARTQTGDTDMDKRTQWTI